MKFHDKTIVAFHHSSIDSRIINPQYQAIKNGHDKRFGRDDMEYAALFERDGTIILHPDGLSAVLYNVGDYNEQTIGACFAGNMLMERPTLKQWDACIRFMEMVGAQGHNIQRIANHRELRPTICPKIDLVGLYNKELDKRWEEDYTHDYIIASKIRRLLRGILRANEKTARLLRAQLTRLTKRADKLECC